MRLFLRKSWKLRKKSNIPHTIVTKIRNRAYRNPVQGIFQLNERTGIWYIRHSEKENEYEEKIIGHIIDIYDV